MISNDVFSDAGFQSTVAKTLTKMSHQEAVQAKPTATKAGQTFVECRDTTNPHMLTEFLVSFLEAIGSRVSVPRIWKNTRDEVLWSTGVLPWHRSPLWLLTRVAMQTTFSGLNPARDYYKEFMVVFMAKAIAQAMSVNTPCDILHCMVSKVSRRLSKLRIGDKRASLDFVENTLSRATEHLELVWREIVRDEPDIQLQQLRSLDFKGDTVLRLQAVDNYIQFISQPAPSENLGRTFSPEPIATEFPNADLPVLPPLDVGVPQTDYVLAAFEDWVSSNLDQWLAVKVSDHNTCGLLRALIAQYHDIARRHYVDNPENISLMLLTCLELWIACDKAATRLYSLMLEYRPEVPSELLESLILPQHSHLVRLARVEDYVSEREMRASSFLPSWYSEFGHEKSFAVRYFATSTDLRGLYQEIERWAAVKREQKLAQLAQEQQRYKQLMASFDASECQYIVEKHPKDRNVRPVHNPECTRCKDRKTATSLTIDVDEWPLPRDTRKAKATVFELWCPQAFNDWRDATLLLVVDVMRSCYLDARQATTRFRPGYGYRKFSQYISPRQRLQLISETKYHEVTHRRTMPVSEASAASICVNNGLDCDYYDHQSDCYATKLLRTKKIPVMCTYQLQRYKPLQQFIHRPPPLCNGPTHNEVISHLHTCPIDMSLEEFKSAAGLALGIRIQWSNILLQLSLPSIDFKEMDTALMLLQVIRQCGPRSNECVERDGHGDLCDEEFGSRLMRALQGVLERIKENWESRHALESFIAISSRLLSLTRSEPVITAAQQYLRSCRQVALGWAHKLRTMTREATDRDRRDEFLRQAFETALLCMTTFDVESCYLRAELQQSSQSAVFIECSMILQDTSHAAVVSGDVVQRMAVQRWRRLSHRALSHLRTGVIRTGRDCIDIAIRKIWLQYRPGSSW
jgi:hypothetical protein